MKNHRPLRALFTFLFAGLVTGLVTTIAYGQVPNQVTTAITVRPGWNLLSTTGSDPQLSHFATDNKFYLANEVYVHSQEYPPAGYAFWLFQGATSAVDVTLSTAAATTTGFALQPGWNLVGPTLTNSLNEVVLNPVDFATLNVYKWLTNRWELHRDNAFIPGQGYMIFSPRQQLCTNSLTRSLSDSQKNDITQLADNACQQWDIPGITFAVKFWGEAPWEAAVGYAQKPTEESRAEGIPMQPGHLMRIGSASKTFAAMAILKLIKENKCWLDQPISAIDQTLRTKLANYDVDKITIRMLLQHNSGLASYTNFIEKWAMPYLFTPENGMTNDQLLKIVNDGNAEGGNAEGAQTGTPGFKVSYSNTNYIVVDELIKTLTGQTAREYIRENFIVPLGLAHTAYPDPGVLWPSLSGTADDSYAHGYMDKANYFGEPSLPSGLADVTMLDTSLVGAAGAMISTAADLSRWMEAISTNAIDLGQLKAAPTEWRLFILSGTQPDWNLRNAFGLGMAHEADASNNSNYDVIGHRGQIAGYDAAMISLPGQACSLAFICNRSLWNEANWPTNALAVIGFKIVHYLFPDMVAEAKLTTTRSAGVVPDGLPLYPPHPQRVLQEY
ncbi:serine hydrolase domain-containing protein [Oligosphaera ethanolica]|uniref:CubicO group peptidase (Beta-lactamase class C family) n=1 Tax=Oligosphaera ethanolica TaxID=760260 RepID=A0AAE3VE88_9BACT|nr:serine hydrolase domain-containing protein [Oligosphaera ethanolica]MDQ0288811.1 CubicO group peptidase (beta-lactamase class C family) [Oligosphaera ethanolica]